MTSLVGNMREHLEQIIEKINNNEHFGLIRPSDGEFLILENHTFTAQTGDDWTNKSDGLLREHLKEAIKTINPKLYIGIPCNTCGHNPSSMYDDYLTKYQVPKNNLTYANIFCNANWSKTIEFLKSYEKGFFLITTGTLECDFPIKERCYIDKFLVNNWNEVWETETERILNYIKDKQNELICFASGPMTKVWIPKCMELNPNNIYLDIGSVLDYYTKGTIRLYTHQNTTYSKECCNFV